jgi:hypothetical protein
MPVMDVARACTDVFSESRAAQSCASEPPAVVVDAPAPDAAAVVDEGAVVDVAAAVDVAAGAAVVGLDELSLPHPTANRATATRDKKSVAVVRVFIGRSCC